MTSEWDKAKQWWCFDTRDLLLFTAIVAASVAAIQILGRHYSAPNWTIAAQGLPVVGVVVGGLARQFRGAVIGILVGGLAAAVVIVVGALVFDAPL